ncbi:hypothetical protein M5689_014467 [Euphorbia peplus]|nr:hypothetical protein M5689_014467 [Euphorbia peplus]
MVKTAENQDEPSSLCFSRISFLYFAVFLVSSLVFVCLGFSPFIVTISILCLSSIFLITKKKSSSGKNSPESQEVEQKVNQESEADTLLSEAAKQSQVSEFQDYQVESTDCPTASESSSDDFSATEGFELNWACFDNLGKNIAVPEMIVFSDDDDEDEDDNLIEINFPDNSSVELNEESEEQLQIDFANSEPKIQRAMPESVYMQEGFMELLEEMNEVTEEDNLIEIDLSMGSIKGHNY